MKTGIKIYLVLSGILLIVLSCKVFFAIEPKSELTLNKLTIIDRNSGKPVLILADSVPDGVINGKVLPRIFKPRGMVYFDNKGNETGGLIVNNQEGMETAMFTVDYNNTDAFSIFKNETDTTYAMGIAISDRNTEEEFRKRGTGGTPRIVIQNRDKNAIFAMTDTKGRERVVFVVGRNDDVQLLVLDTLGKTVKNLATK
ncbi:hypothetical protein CHU92_11415 [Flavobacterium cyanobacteriorum]|uniref:Uncharacterized protein n=1 Tax=Flavobacterium cyanobacteriorum TaxID=2022802 RepID=A0A255Z1C5_9FLAO|nr:hypothetical protein [Flavobacterium cyanobacteriorum]OYQ34734.1 hypothetical protein CHU92_11415 [Flavobacterium cyanobacteriorum]